MFLRYAIFCVFGAIIAVGLTWFSAKRPWHFWRAWIAAVLFCAALNVLIVRLTKPARG